MNTHLSIPLSAPCMEGVQRLASQAGISADILAGRVLAEYVAAHTSPNRPQLPAHLKKLRGALASSQPQDATGDERMQYLIKKNR